MKEIHFVAALNTRFPKGGRVYQPFDKDFPIALLLLSHPQSGMFVIVFVT